MARRGKRRAASLRRMGRMIDVALKEWRLVCDLLLTGELALLLRKGGIHEDSVTGEFELAYRRFGLYPTYEHQDAAMLKPAYGARLGDDPDASRVTIGGWAEAARVWTVPSRAAFDRLDELHPWSGAYVDMRFEYRPDRPLYLAAVRAHALVEPRTIDFRAAFAGCRSWVPLEADEAIDESASKPVMAEGELHGVIERVDAVFGSC